MAIGDKQATLWDYDMDRIEKAWAAIGVKIDRVKVEEHYAALRKYYGPQRIEDGVEF